MNKADLINAVAEKTGAKKKDAEVAVNAMTACIEEALTAGEKVQIILKDGNWLQTYIPGHGNVAWTPWVCKDFIKL